MCESFLSLAFLTEFGKDPNATTLFFLALCFAQNPIKWATCRMTKLVNKTVFFKVVDFGWKSWFCVFALIKYRWITWAADNFLSSRGKKRDYFIPLWIMSALPIDGEKEEVKMIFFSQF